MRRPARPPRPAAARHPSLTPGRSHHRFADTGSASSSRSGLPSPASPRAVARQHHGGAEAALLHRDAAGLLEQRRRSEARTIVRSRRSAQPGSGEPLDSVLLRFQRAGFLQQLVHHDPQVLPVQFLLRRARLRRPRGQRLPRPSSGSGGCPTASPALWSRRALPPAPSRRAGRNRRYRTSPPSRVLDRRAAAAQLVAVHIRHQDVGNHQRRPFRGLSPARRRHPPPSPRGSHPSPAGASAWRFARLSSATRILHIGDPVGRVGHAAHCSCSPLGRARTRPPLLEAGCSGAAAGAPAELAKELRFPHVRDGGTSHA